MSLRELDEDGLDRLADYVAGVLDGDEAAAVAHRVASDPVWRTAHAELTAAERDLPWLLRDEAAHPAEPMPADVVARVDAALAAEAARPDATRPDTARPRLVAVADRDWTPGGSVTPRRSGPARPAGPARRRRSASRAWAGGLIAAAVAGVVGVGVAIQAGVLGVQTTTADSAGMARDAGTKETAQSPAVALGGTRILTSGLDYHADTLPAAVAGAPVVGDTAGGTADPNATRPAPIAPGLESRTPYAADLAGKGLATLSRLLDGAALAACRDAVAQLYPGPVVSIDYARYAETPALIMVIARAAPAAPVVVAVGADCGQAGAGADKLAATD